jgi:hypothetical protein
MAAGKHGSSEIVITYDDPSGAPQTITCAVLTMGAIKITSQMQAGTAYCDTIEKQLPTGLEKIDQVTLTGFWDTTPVTGSHDIFKAPDTNPQAPTRTLGVMFGDAKQWTSEGYQVSYSVIGKVGNLTEFEAVLQQNSGAWS